MDIHYIHIGKTGGSAIKASLWSWSNSSRDLNRRPASFSINMLSEGKLKEKEYNFLLHSHKQRFDKQLDGKYIFFIRDPLNRYVSSFISRFRQGRPRYNVRYGLLETITFRFFKTPNQLAEVLSSHNRLKRICASMAMLSITQVRKSITYYLRGLDNVKKNQHKIFFVGTTENLDTDFYKMTDLLGIDNARLVKDPIESHKTPAEYEKMKFLSDRAKDNLIKWYREDYNIIFWLIEAGIVKQDYRKYLSVL